MVGLNDLHVAVNGSPVATQHVLMSGPEVPGLLHTAMVTGPGALVLDVGVFLADEVKLDRAGLSLCGLVWCRQKIGGPDIFGRLERRQRVGLYRMPDGNVLMELAVLVPSQGGEWANAKRLPLAETDAVVGGSVDSLLRGRGFVQVGYRSDLFGDPSRRRNTVAASIPGADPVEPAIWGYCLTRVVPLLRSLEERS